MQSNATAAVPAGDRLNASGRSATILVVDDQLMVVSALRRVFRRDGYTILSATGGAAALEILEQVRCDVVIADYLMPQMDGVELLRRVKRRWPHVACVMLTGHAELEVLKRVVRRGLLCKFALKPWNDRDLREAVADALAAIPPARPGDRRP